MSGTSITSAATSAAKQLQSLHSDNPSAVANLSQLQLLGLNPDDVQKYLKANAATGASAASGPDLLQTIMEMKVQQDAMQESMDKLQKASEPNAEVKPNEIYGHDFFGTGKLALFFKTSDAKAPDSYILGVDDEISIAVWG